jgi:dihydroorotate dehydrogenase
VGGASSALEVYSKIKAGASAVQLYSALIFNGFSLVEKIIRELDILLENDGYENIKQAVGVEREKWL